MDTTYEDILNLFRENDRKIKELLRSQQETDLKFQEVDRKFQKFQEVVEAQQEVNRPFRETDREFAKLEELFTSPWGQLMESLMEGSLVDLLNVRGMDIAYTTTRLKGKRPGGVNYEFDLIAHNGEEVVVVEVKTTLRPDDVKHFLDKLDHLKDWVPRYAQNRIYGAMAWLSADASAEAMVIKRGLFSIRATGDSASIQNDPAFTPHAW